MTEEKTKQAQDEVAKQRCFACGSIPSRRIDKWDDTLCPSCEKLGNEWNRIQWEKGNRVN